MDSTCSHSTSQNCKTRTDDLPTYESLHSAIPDTATHQHSNLAPASPSRSESEHLDTEIAKGLPRPSLPAARSVEERPRGDWNLRAMVAPHTGERYWYRTTGVLGVDQIHHQYGCFKRALIAGKYEPVVSFTCKGMPIGRWGHIRYHYACELAIHHMDRHRRKYQCGCDFDSVRQCPRARLDRSLGTLWRKFWNEHVVASMDHHNKACSCGCFSSK